MGRVSLTEDYDDRSVISKLNEMDKRVTENTTVVTAAEASAKASAQAAQETADRFAGSVGAVVQNANAQINASKAQVDQAKAEVDETVTTVAQAVQTANNASASAQQSAQTVAGYDSRLTAVENADTQNVKLEGNQSITGKKDFNGWDNITLPNVTYLKGAQPDNWKHFISIDGTGNYDIMQARRDALDLQHSNIIRTSAVGSDSRSVITKAYVESTDGATNNLVHRTTNETISGVKDFVSQIKLSNSSWRFDCVFPDLNNANPSAVTGYIRIGAGSGSVYEIGRIQYSIRDNGNRYFALYLVDKTGGYHSKVLFEIDNDGNVVV